MNIQPPSAIVMGAPGSGKTYALASAIRAGLELFVISTEPDGVASLIDACEATKAPISRLHWATCLPIVPGWSALNDMATSIGSMSFEQIQNIKSGIGKSDTRQAAMKLLNTLANFKCERTGESFGDFTKWPDTRALALDSLSGLSMISWMLGVGYKPAAHQGEWGVTMNFIEQLLLKISSDRKCFFFLNSHVEKEFSELSGIQQVMVSTLGRKLAPKITRYFSEVVYAKRLLRDNTAKFTWSTVDSNAELKNRSLPIASDLPQDYKPIVEAYRRRIVAAQAAE